MYLFEFPQSLILALAFLMFLVGCRRTPLAPLFRGRVLSSALIVAAALFVAVEGTWGYSLHRHWSFVVLTVLLMTSLGYVAVSDFRTKSLSALMSHAGLFLVLFGGLFGAPDCTDGMMRVYLQGAEEHMVVRNDGSIAPLPFNVSLEDFTIDRYDDGVNPKQFTSTLAIDGKVLRTGVNRPGRYKGYSIYQSGYDSERGEYSVLKIVRDPWLPVVALGALLLSAAAVLSLKKVWDSWKTLVAAFVLAIVFGILSVARISFGTLPPALRSLWFVPHLIVYMLAYAVMALAVIAAVASLFSSRIPHNLSRKLLSTASSLLLIGMICGAVWAKQAWGDYWTWDSKECWAAVTWLLTLAGTHFHKKKAAMVFTIISFLAIQMTWYGVNYLPSSGNSLHTYNLESEI